MPKRFKGRKKNVHWCRWKDCPFAIPLQEALCERHKAEAIVKLDALGYLRPSEEQTASS